MGLNSYNSPIGPIAVESLYGEVISIRFKSVPTEQLFPDDTTEFCIEQLQSYFSGNLKRFSVPYKLAVTDFQESVLKKVAEIPFSSTLSYSDLAKELGNKDLVRAVGASNAKNPIPILIPCHRVIGLNGALVGYVGGLNAKKWLLEHEGMTKQLSLF